MEFDRESTGTATLADFMKQDAGSHGYVQGVYLAEKRDGEEYVAVFPYQRPHPLALAAHDETDISFKADGTKILVRPGIGPVNPKPIFL